MQVYLVQTTLALPMGGVACVPVKICADREKAEKERAERQGALRGLMSAKLVIPKGGDEATDTGIVFAQALADLGVLGFATHVVEIDVEDPPLVSLATPEQVRTEARRIIA